MTNESSALGGVSSKVALGVAVAVIGIGLAIGHFLDWISGQIIGSFIAGGFVVVLALLVVRVALQTVRPVLRMALFLYVLLFAAVAIYPASEALRLGRPSSSGIVSESNRSLALPSEGIYRVLVRGHLSTGSDARISYRFKAGEAGFEGALTRDYVVRRARRGPGIQGVEDHDLKVHEVSVTGSPATLVLDSIGGGTELTLEAFRVVPELVIWLFMGLVALAGMFLEAKAPSNGTVVMTGASAVFFGLIIKIATPTSMGSATFWSALLGAGGGAIGGSILNAAAKKIFGVAKPPDRKLKAES